MCTLQFHCNVHIIKRTMMNEQEERRCIETVAPAKEWLTYSEAQQYAGIGRTKLWSLVVSGEVPAAKVGKAVRISRAGLDEYMQRHSYVEVISR